MQIPFVARKFCVIITQINFSHVMDRYSPNFPNKPPKAMRKPKTLPSIQTPVSAEHLLFNFYFIPNCPNYITKLNCPTKNSAWKFNAPPNSPSSKLSKIIYQNETKTKTTTQKLQTPNPNSHPDYHLEKSHPLHPSTNLL